MTQNVRVENGKIVITEEGRIREIPLAAIGSYGELLGYSCPWETIDALIKMQDTQEPEPDPETGENVWTDSFYLLKHRETARDKAYFQAEEEGTAVIPQSPTLRSSMAAYNTVHQKIEGGDCVMDRCRASARKKLGLDAPTQNAGVSSRLRSKGFGIKKVTAKTELQTEIEDAVTPHLDKIPGLRESFLSELTPFRGNPFAETVEEVPETSEPRNFIAEMEAKYGGDA